MCLVSLNACRRDVTCIYVSKTNANDLTHKMCYTKIHPFLFVSAIQHDLIKYNAI